MWVNLLIAILSSAFIVLIFRWFPRFRVHTFQAIVWNYVTAFTCGYLVCGGIDIQTEIVETPWFFNGFLLGVLFISLFRLMALCSQKVSVSITTVANKMAVVCPVLVAFIHHGDEVTLLKIIGITLAIIAVWLSSFGNKSGEIDKKYLYLPIVLFLGGGAIDVLIDYTQRTWVAPHETGRFTSSIFGIAGALGAIVMIGGIAMGKIKFELRNIIAGIILGIPNFASIYFLLKVIEGGEMESSALFPINNMGVVISSAVLSFLIFKEKFGKQKLIGIALSVVAIYLIAFNKLHS